MLFKRREPEGFLSRFRTALWPRRSFGRSVQYFMKRVVRLTATPHAIAAGVAAGVFASWTPFLGFHFVIAAGLAFLLAGNLLASALATGFGNPITFPFIWGGTHKLGNFLLGERRYKFDHGDVNLVHHFKRVDWWDPWDVVQLFERLWHPFLKPMSLGAIPLGILTAAIFYAVTYWAVKSYQERRKLMLARNVTASAPDHT